MAVVGWLAAAGRALAFDASTLSEVGLNLGSNPYWSHPVFANALWNGEGWLEYAEGQFGSSVFFEANPQFDANGLPRHLNTGQNLRALVYALHASPSPLPAGWPDRTLLARGKVVLTWRGDADIRASGGAYISAESSGASTGRLVNGRRVYRFTGSARLSWITVEAINAAQPVTDLKLWLPDPADPDNRSLENQLFHPTYLATLGDVAWAFLRCMDWNASNGSPQKDWADRRGPQHVFQQGVLNRRVPATGFSGDRATGIAFEHMVAICNATGRDLWINVPHLATDDFVTKLAQLIRFGSDGVNPYAGAVTNPVYPPLRPHLRVFVEYSNEIWSSGGGFPQGDWAQDQATALGITKERFNARRFCQVWRLFETVFAGETSRMVRVAAVWTSMQSYTQGFLDEIAAYSATLTPPQAPDVIAPTTYFGNGIQDWAYSKALQQAGTADPWFLTTNMFTDGGTVRPVSLPAAHAYWTGTNVTRHLAETFAEWKRRQLSGTTQTGGGPDATGVGGGFDAWLRSASATAFGQVKPIVSYEGGPSLYSDYLDGGDERDDGITTFLTSLNRQPEFAQLYRVHLNLAKAKGLRTHGAYTDVGAWGKYGQWGHLEFLGQARDTAVKWKFLRDWPAEMAGLRSVEDPAGAVPQFSTVPRLATAVHGQLYSQEISVSGGDGLLAIDVLERLLTAGLDVTPVPASPPRLRVSGIPVGPGENWVFARVHDADGDPAWRTFYFRTVGGPGTILESSFEGANPAQQLPWKTAYVLGTGVSYSGWVQGAGIIAAAGPDALVWSQSMPPDEANSRLALALANNRYWQITLTPPADRPLNLRSAELRFTIRRIDYHSPRQYAVFTSVGGFTEGAQVFDTGHFTDDTDREFVFTLPAAAAYENITGPVTFRLYGYGGQYDGHRTSLRAFRLAANLATLVEPFDRWKSSHGLPPEATPASDADNDGIPLLVEYALNLDPAVASRGGLPFGQLNDGFLTMTYTRVKTATDVAYSAEVAASPTGPWSATDAEVEQRWQVTDGGDVESVTARARTPIAGASQRFLRLKLTKL
jgi:hypothetical protein